MSQIHDLTALEIAAAIQAGDLTAQEVTQHFLQRIAQHNAAVGGFLSITAEGALAQAAAADAAIRTGDPLRPLHGVPIAIKDLNLTAGVRTTFGSEPLKDFIPIVDDHVVTLLRAAGTISLGKTNTPEFGLTCYTESDVGPPARTPWDLTCSAGGSSGGAGAAVAAGLVPCAQGSDGGGSIRIPASVCGLVGLKVSRGRISNGPLGGDTTGLAWNGPLARSVTDAAALLDAMAVPMPGDPHWTPPLPAGQKFLDWARRDPGRLRIGRCITPPTLDLPVHADCWAAWEDATSLLRGLGHEVDDIPPLMGPDVVDHFEVVWATSALRMPVSSHHIAKLRPITQWLQDRGRRISAARYLEAFEAMQLAARQAIVSTVDYDAILTPTLAMPPQPVGWFTETGDPADDFAREKLFTPFTAVCNITGQPAINMPLYWTAGGVPIGIMLAGRPAGEAQLLSLAGQLERARPWVHRHPPIW